jgi:hypothetical protein
MNELNPEKYRTDLAIVRETADQVLKDFGVFGIEIVFSGDAFTAWDELKQQLIPVLYEMYQGDHTRFQSLLYRIDLNESKFRKLLGQVCNQDLPEMLAEMILQREFQKVLTRRYFSDKKNS